VGQPPVGPGTTAGVVGAGAAVGGGPEYLAFSNAQVVREVAGAAADAGDLQVGESGLTDGVPAF